MLRLQSQLGEPRHVLAEHVEAAWPAAADHYLLAGSGVAMRNTAPGEPIGWLAYYSDSSAFAIFDSEIKALRYAVDHEMKVRALADGQQFGSRP